MKDLFGHEAPEPETCDVVTSYVPWDWVDEYSPEPSADVLDFLKKDSAGGWCLRPSDEDLAFRDSDEFFISLKPGDAIPFAAHRMYPDVGLIVHDDGSYRTAPNVPADANCFFADDPDSMSDSIEELIKGHGLYGDGLEPGLYSLTNYHWSGPVMFEFQVLKGVPGFVRRGMVS